MTAVALLEAIDRSTISPYKEAIAYEYLYSREGMTLKELANLTVHKDRLPTEALADYAGLLGPDGIDVVEEFFDRKLVRLPFHVAVRGTTSWPIASNHLSPSPRGDPPVVTAM